MDPNLSTIDRSMPAISPEPSSTRPNPFVDESDVTARKRRRTSASGSPTAAGDNTTSSDPLHDEQAIAALAMPAHQHTGRPQTPENQQTNIHSPQQPPSSSRVTINIRPFAHDSVGIDIAGPSLPASTQGEQLVSQMDEIKKSVEIEPDAPRDSQGSPGTLRQSSNSASPPIEILPVSGNEDQTDFEDVTIESFDGPISLIEDNMTFPDPTLRFPFREFNNDNLQTTVQRLINHLLNEAPVDVNILRQLLEWLDHFLNFEKQIHVEDTSEICHKYQHFWHVLADLPMALANRRPPIYTYPGLRVMAINICCRISTLAARFAVVDQHSLHQWRENRLPLDGSGPILFSITYLHSMHNLARRMDPELHDACVEASAGMWNWRDHGCYFLRHFQTASRGSLEPLAKIVADLVEIVPGASRLSESLVIVVETIADWAGQSRRDYERSQNPNKAQRQLKLCFEAWEKMSRYIETAIDKNISYVNANSSARLIKALTTIFEASLSADIQPARAIIESHQMNHVMPIAQTVEALGWEWKINILTKMIRFGLMHHRVMAVTILCGDLVNMWRSLGEGQNPETSMFLDYLGDHLLESGLISYILGPNCHPEIVMESANIIGFVIVTKRYGPVQMDGLWQGITGSQDPRVADALTRMASSIANLFDYRALLGFCEKLHSLPIEGFNPAIRELWDSVARDLVVRCRQENMILSPLPYKVCLRLLRDSSVCMSGSQIAYPDIQQSEMHKFESLLHHGPDVEGRRELLLSCIEDIASKSSTTLGSLWCLSMAMRKTAEDEVKILTKEHSLVQLIVEELEHAIEVGKSHGVSAVLSGNSNQPRRSFITNLIRTQPDLINEEYGERLWNILIGSRSPCAEDRRSGWKIISDAEILAAGNPFIQFCLSKHLPQLPSACFSMGTLEFIQTNVQWMVNMVDCSLDDTKRVTGSSIEQLWRIILEAKDNSIVEPAIKILAIDVYLESKTIMSYPFHRARQVHLGLVNRCLNQLRDASAIIKASSDGTSSGEDEPMIIVATEDEIEKQELAFIRTLKLLRLFLRAHRSKPLYSASDLGSIIPLEPSEVEGDLAQLKYQSFDGNEQTDVKPLTIGRRNTAAALLASLRRETGFEAYRVFYRGHQFLPTEEEISKSLEDLHVHDGLMLVKKEEGSNSPPVRVKPGSSSLEIEILAHFQQLWGYLSMEERIAKEIYHFLADLPVGGELIEQFENDAITYKDIFVHGQPFKSLYAIHALAEYAMIAGLAASGGNEGVKYQGFTHVPYGAAVTKSLNFVVQAISDQELLDKLSPELKTQLLRTLMQTLLKLLQESQSAGLSEFNQNTTPPTPRLLEILSEALDTKDEVATDYIVSTYACILRMGLRHSDFWDNITTSSDLADLTRRLILFDSRPSVRTAFTVLIEEAFDFECHVGSAVLDDMQGGRTFPCSIMRFIWPILSDLLNSSINFPGQCYELFHISICLLQKIPVSFHPDMDIRGFAERLGLLLLNHASTETIDQLDPDDPIARGLVLTLYTCLDVDTSFLTDSPFPRDFAEQLFWTHLFPPRQSDVRQPVARVILNSETRSKLCEIIFRFAREDEDSFAGLLDSLNSLLPFYTKDEDDPYLYELPSKFERSSAIKAPCGYVGLRNLSNTCYLNSLFTQLYMNPQLRNFIMRSTVTDPDFTQQLLFYTQKLFGHMQESYRRFVDPCDVVSSVKTYEDTFIDVTNQMDVDEFYNLIFDRWEAQLQTADEKRKLRAFYGGQLVQQVKSQECEHVSERLEPFSAIQCEIKGKKSLQESLQAYVGGEIMEGDNKYKCSTCDTHVNAVKRACLKDIPNHLIFHLKRFDWNLRSMERSKINDHFSFPTVIDMRPYTIDYLTNPECSGEEDLFELVGILVHTGTAESGHYYSYIKERPSPSRAPSWFEFNDERVTPWDSEMMAGSTFGGPTDHGVEKAYSAYMLFYQRSSSLHREQLELDARGLVPPFRVDLDSQLTEHIRMENTLILRRHCLYDPGHTVFVENCFGLARRMDQQRGHGGGILEGSAPSHEFEEKAVVLALSHLDQVVTRNKDGRDFGRYSSMIKAAISNCASCALAVYDYFHQRPGAFKAMVQRNPDAHIRDTVGQMFISALAKISEEMPEVYYAPRLRNESTESSREDEDSMDGSCSSHSSSEISVLEGSVLLLNYVWKFFQSNIRSWDEVFGTILSFARLGDREVNQLLINDYLVRLSRIISADVMMQQPPMYAKMLNNILNRTINRPPSYVSIIATINYLLHQLEPILNVEHIVEKAIYRHGLHTAPYPWSEDEINLFHSHPQPTVESCFFVEKLLTIDQAQEASHEIIGRLVNTGSEMDVRIFNALRTGLQGDVATSPMEPFLRGAERYLESTVSNIRAGELIRHIGAQAKALQHSEGTAFLEFFSLTLNWSKNIEQMNEIVRECSLVTTTLWAPHLLVYSDVNVRSDAEQMLNEEIFLPAVASMDDSASAHSEILMEVTWKICHQCLIFLREAHIRQRVPIGRDAATVISRVIQAAFTTLTKKESSEYDSLGDLTLLRTEVLTSLRRLVVDEIDDDGSDWDGSGLSSDPLEGQAEIGLQPNNELDTNLI